MHLRLPAAAAAVLAAAGLAGPAAAGAAPVTTSSHITQNGIGPLRIGMTIDQAQRRTGQAIDYQRFDAASDACGIGRLLPASLGVTMLTTDRRIAVLSVSRPGISTRRGIEVGDTVRDLRRAYGARLRSRVNRYDPRRRDHVLRLGDRAMIFWADRRGVIGQIDGGRRPEIDYVEGCA
ncbi:MAG: hypothetical protein IRZ32_15290 [Solirubrobacteraceae bacterium]|nr:hypothetical protein [Solirubrobacteraceae bacterium]